MSNNKSTLLFVYNANSGLVNKLIDFTHKSIKPSTYPCSLCQLTYGIFKVDPKWTAFIKGLAYEVKFLYENEIDSSNYNLPVILLEDSKSKTSVLSDCKTLSSFNSLEELIDEINSKLNNLIN
jgi:hypothetical protein